MHYNIRALQIFECVYRHGSIIGASMELAITPSAISHQLRHLRIQVGEGLIEKNGRKLIFSQRGIRLAQSLSFAFSHIQSSVSQSVGDAQGVLRVAACSCFGSGWLIRRIKQCTKLADLNIQLKMQPYDPDLGDATADVFFTNEPLKDGFWSTKLLDEELVAVTGPDRSPAKCEPRCTLISTNLDHRKIGEDWVRFADFVQRKEMLQGASFVGASHYIFALEMAEHSLGIGLVPHFLAEGAVAKRRVVLWHQGRMPSGRSYFMNIKQARRHEPQIRDFASWVRRTASQGA
ncbi:hypothetical protein ASC97_14125 [Rhizobium sp. Root1203]|uniref:LysR family transcriptional regulator n=1 Tax=Rhizobium sp. Root1203 TaxID=1736427 RepID=UPI00070B4AE1|nr:LysR family transcriptional regulator [Rhizobium sp. Root1203]KQV12286.1 hypothetical protein ASC97_14125 [Rhizobium sp. Root1203]